MSTRIPSSNSDMELRPHSRLLSLPFEVRERIWGELLGYSKATVYVTPSLPSDVPEGMGPCMRYIFFDHRSTENIARLGQHGFKGPTWAPSYLLNNRSYLGRWPVQPFPPLANGVPRDVCRQYSRDIQAVVCKRTTFAFTEVAVLSDFLDMLTPDQLADIHSIRMQFDVFGDLCAHCLRSSLLDSLASLREVQMLFWLQDLAPFAEEYIINGTELVDLGDILYPNKALATFIRFRFLNEASDTWEASPWQCKRLRITKIMSDTFPPREVDDENSWMHYEKFDTAHYSEEGSLNGAISYVFEELFRNDEEKFNLVDQCLRCKSAQPVYSQTCADRKPRAVSR